MTLPSSGTIKFTDIEGEFGQTSPRSLSKYYGIDAGIPSSGQIKFSDFYGKVINATRTIGDATNFNAASDFTNASIVGGLKSASTVSASGQAVKYYITVNGTIGSTSTSTTAFDTGSFPAGSSVYLTNNSYIVGAGGRGGDRSGGNGSPGGNALTLKLPTFITNNGTIGGGGGGGSAGGDKSTTSCQQDGCCHQTCYTATGKGGGGGGGAGSVAGSGGNGGGTGSSGSLLTGGSGGGGTRETIGSASEIGDNGAAGGNLGQNGGNSGGTGGTRGNYIVNNNYATWVVSGTLLGGVG